MFDFNLNPDQEQHAKELHRKIVTVDMLFESSMGPDFFENVKAGDLTCGSFTIGTGGLRHFQSDNKSIPNHEEFWSRDTTLTDFAYMNKVFNDDANTCVQVLCIDDIHKANVEQKNGIILNTQNSIMIGTDVDNLDVFYNLGLRVIQITYNLQNYMASGCLEAPEARLSNFGRQAIERMNEIGIQVDTGHTGEGSILEACDVSTKPVCCSHAGLAALSPPNNPRVQTDRALKAIASTGGVFGLSAIPGMLVGKDRCTINDYLDHLDYAVNLIGVDHVGIGSDFVEGPTLEQIAAAPDWKGQQVPTNPDVWPVCSGHEGFENHSKYPNLTRGLIARGYCDDDVAKIMGGNFLRMLADTIG